MNAHRKLTQWLDQESKISPRYSVSDRIKQKNSLIHISGFVAFLHRFPSTSKNWLSHLKLPGTKIGGFQN